MRERDAHQLADAVRRDYPGAPAEPPPPPDHAPPIKVIDCVLSLHRDYKRVVEPRVSDFAARHPELRTCADLRDAMGRSESAATFLYEHLDLKDPTKAGTLVGVLEYVLEAQERFDAPTEEGRLRAWAKQARPGDYLEVGVRGFAFAGFQYLRLYFGADTTTPDRHIIKYVTSAVGHQVSDVDAVYTMDRAARLGGFSAAWVDHEIWKRTIHKRPAPLSPPSTSPSEPL